MIRRSKPFLLGTFVDICVLDSVACASEAIESAFNRMREIHNRLSFYDIESDLNKLNSTSSASLIYVSSDLVRVLLVCLELNEISNGVFNPAITPVLQELEILPKFSFNIQAAHFSPLQEAIEVQSSNQVLIKKAICLDLGGIAKGYAVDEACRVLQSFGIKNAIVNAGGDIRTFGEQKHKIAIRNPHSPHSMGFDLLIQNQALATSATYNSFNNFKSLSQVDGRTGQLCAEFESVSILAEKCIYADALTKIAFFLKEQDLNPILEYYNAELYLTVNDSNIDNQYRYNALNGANNATSL